MKYIILLVTLITGMPIAHAFPDEYTELDDHSPPDRFELYTGFPNVHVQVAVQVKNPVNAVLLAVTRADRSSIDIVEAEHMADLVPNLVPKTPLGLRVWLDNSEAAEMCPAEGLPLCVGEVRYFMLRLSKEVTSAGDILESNVYVDYGGMAHVSLRLAESAKHPSYPTPIGGIPRLVTYGMSESSQQSISDMTAELDALNKKDAVALFGLRRIYDTPLKLQIFKRSKEFKDLEKFLTELRRQALEGRLRYCHTVTLSDYDVKRRGFTISDGLRSGELTLDVRGFGESRGRKEKGFRNFVKADEKSGVAIEAAESLAMCFKIAGLTSRVRKVPYKVDPWIVKLMSAEERRLYRTVKLQTVFKEYRVEATHLLLGSMRNPDAVYVINNGRIVNN